MGQVARYTVASASGMRPSGRPMKCRACCAATAIVSAWGAAMPMHLRNAPTGLMKDMGYGKDYKYAHDYDGNFTPMQNLPESLKGRRYYHPGDQGYETTVAERMKRWWSESNPE